MSDQSITLEIDGMTCAGCAGRVERAVNATQGVDSAVVNFATGRAHVLASSKVSFETLASVVSQAGYKVISGPKEDTPKEVEVVKRRAFLAAGLTVPIIIVEMGSHAVPAFHHWLMATFGQGSLWTMQFVLATLVLFWPGMSFFRIGLPALFRAAPEMNSLVALGAGAAWLYSCAALFVPQALPQGRVEVYFEAAAVIVTLILVGRWLEARARRVAGAAIEKLMSLQPNVAVRHENGMWQEVPITAVVPGDMLRVLPGTSVPVDGRVVAGASFVDESMMTGEPIPVEKADGSSLVGGSLNGEGVLEMRAEVVGEDTVLAGIVRQVEEAQGNKLPVQALADAVIRMFVPAVLVIALFTFAVWLAMGGGLASSLTSAVSVLIVACPCAMGLAVPTSVMVATGRAAELGVLFRRGDALQRLASVNVIAFDKTGTLTEGKPELVFRHFVDGVDETEVIRQAAAVEALSEHPISRAITRAHDAELPVVSEFQATAGFGIAGQVEGLPMRLGTARFMRDDGIALDELEDVANAIAKDGKTPVFVARDGVAIGVLGVADQIKPSAAASIRLLRSRGLELAIVTGDVEASAARVGRALGIDHVVAGLLPDAKVRAVEDLGDDGASVAFVGDGINDAPALARANVGIALGSGTDVAMETADVVLGSGDLIGVAKALHLSRMAMRNIKQNLFWAFAYNVALIPIAAGILYPGFGIVLSPVLAAAAMALSSVCVVTNALRLRAISGEMT